MTVPRTPDPVRRCAVVRTDEAGPSGPASTTPTTTREAGEDTSSPAGVTAVRG